VSTNVLPVLTHVSAVNQERQKLVLVGIRELCRTDYFRAKNISQNGMLPEDRNKRNLIGWFLRKWKN
jgi:hypothetical protein